MITPLLTTKLHIPPVRPGLVSRPRLVERLDAGLHRKLTLVVALMKWVSIPFLGLLLYHLVTSEETLDTVRSRVAVVTAASLSGEETGDLVAYLQTPPLFGGIGVTSLD